MFPTAYSDIIKKVDAIDPVAYEHTRNFKDGALSRLSPYFSRGVIHPHIVIESFKRRGFSFLQSTKFVQEIAWREYFQNLLESKPDLVNTPWLTDAEKSSNRGVPLPLLQANTGIEALDEGLRTLFETGYVHNHIRMYIAALACNIAGCSWQEPGRWMYYHLLDADPASNYGSWQWVAGHLNGKKYVMNQENINRFFYTRQSGNFLDVEYENLSTIHLPEAWKKLGVPDYSTPYQAVETPLWSPGSKVFIYDFFNLDPHWHAAELGDRILLIDVDFFNRFPVSAKTIQFIEQLSKNIQGIKTVYGSFEKIKVSNPGVQFFAKRHPLLPYGAFAEQTVKLFSEVEGAHRSFTSFWKKAAPLAMRFFESH